MKAKSFLNLHMFDDLQTHLSLMKQHLGLQLFCLPSISLPSLESWTLSVCFLHNEWPKLLKDSSPLLRSEATRINPVSVYPRERSCSWVFQPTSDPPFPAISNVDFKLHQTRRSSLTETTSSGPQLCEPFLWNK